MAIGELPLADTTILASAIGSKFGLFTVGSFAKRLNLASQQRRAINLIDAIDRELKISGRSGVSGKRILVVGAGAAGTAAAIAAKLLGARVQIADQKETMFSLLADAEHRVLSPKSNNWPFEDIAYTTYLPFMNWHEDTGVSVGRQLHDQWELYAETVGRLDAEFVSKFELTEINSHNGRWIATGKYGDERLQNIEYDVIVLAMGYGEEEGVSAGYPSYWDNTLHTKHLTELTSKPSNSRTLVVYGNGDGGIIEAVNAAFNRIVPGQFEPELISRLNSGTILERCRKIEHEIRLRLFDFEMQWHADRSTYVKEKASLAAELEAELWQHYKSIFSNLLTSEPRIAELFERDVTTSIPNVVVIGRSRFPFRTTSSPINRVLFTAAISAGFIKYVSNHDQLGVNEADTKIEISANHTFDPTTDGLGKAGYVIEDYAVIWRKGAKSPLGSISIDGIPSSDWMKSVRYRQELYADNDAISVPFARSLIDKLAEHNAPFHDYAQNHLPQAKSFFKKFFFQFSESVDFSLSKKSGRPNIDSISTKCSILERDFEHYFLLSYDDERKRSDSKFRMALNEFPRFVFGVPVSQTTNLAEDLLK